MSSSDLPWIELLDLQVPRKIAQLLSQRWNLGLGFIDAKGRVVRPPRLNEHAVGRGLCQVIQSRPAGESACEASAFESLRELTERSTDSTHTTPFRITCHAGLHELVAPVLIDGQLMGALLCGGFFADSEPGRGDAMAGVARRLVPLALDARALQDAHSRHPSLSEAEISFVLDLLSAAAEEISAFHGETLRQLRRSGEIEREFATRYSYDAIIGRSGPMQDLYSVLDRVVQSESTVLIQGENGTGKELVARAIHYNSNRKSRRFVVTNCSAFNDNLLDSELFGHTKGAFTGAIADKRGLFEAADMGTFFLDEIGDMSPSLQVKVLRVLQEGTFTPVGDTEMRQVDVRIIAATNRDLKAMVERGQFREDLYYRINVINLVIPPLRDRREDIPLLVEHFLKKHTKNNRMKTKRLSDACMERLVAYDWPGNVRELENEIERLMVLAGDERTVSYELLSGRIRRHITAGDVTLEAETRSLPEAVRGLEKRMILEALKRNNWNKTRASAELKVSRRNLIRLVQKYELETERPN